MPQEHCGKFQSVRNIESHIRPRGYNLECSRKPPCGRMHKSRKRGRKEGFLRESVLANQVTVKVYFCNVSCESGVMKCRIKLTIL